MFLLLTDELIMKYFAIGASGIATLLALYLWKARSKNIITKDTVSSITDEEISQFKVKKYYDATSKLVPSTTVYPGDPTLKVETICSVGNGCCFGLSEITMSNHMGTHIDFPAHVLTDGKTSSDYTLNDLSGSGIIIEIPSESLSITAKEIEAKKIDKNSIVFFKTKNSKIPKTGDLSSSYVYIEPDAAEILVRLGVKIIGVDYISVDSLENDHLPTHNILLKNDILIVENLQLEGIDPGKCNVQIAPLNIPDMDGLPARVIISK